MLQQASIEVGPPALPNEGRIRRCHLTPNELVTSPSPDVTVLPDILTHSVAQFGAQKALGWRDVVRVVREEKEVVKMVEGEEVKEMKTWEYFEMGEQKWWSFEEVGEKVKEVGSALVSAGMGRETVFNIYAETGRWWQVIANACASQSITFATAYDSLGEEGLEHSINEPSVYGMFTHGTLLPKLASVISRTPSLKLLIYDGAAKDVDATALETIKSANNGVKVYTIDEFVQLGKETPVEANHPRPEEIACIMYTSGSTGPPKGVQISNSNFVATVASLVILLKNAVDEGVDDCYLAYLPLAHIMEFVVEMFMIHLGVRIGYGTPKTLTDASVRNCLGDLRTFKPTVMVGVPSVWETIRKGILTKVHSGGVIKSKVFHAAFALKRYFGRKSFVGTLMDWLVFSKVGEATGGRLRYALSGGAQLSRETQEFLTISLVAILQGYGMTESTAMCAVVTPDFLQYGVVGVPVPSVEIKLVDVPEANYYSANDLPQGEILIRGPSVAHGYYKLDELTAETITPDGWLRTGDIGMWNADGTLSIIDRRKNLVKLGGGEYIAIERLESVYRSCHLVSNICIYAGSHANRAMAIIVPQEGNLRALVKSNGLALDNLDFEHLCADPKVVHLALKELNAAGKKSGLTSLESLQAVILTPEEWNSQNGLLTAAQKLQRKAIQAKFRSQIEVVYK